MKAFGAVVSMTCAWALPSGMTITTLQCPGRPLALYVNSPEKGGIGRLRHPYIVRAPGSEAWESECLFPMATS